MLGLGALSTSAEKTLESVHGLVDLWYSILFFCHNK
jgi:hypothetical protein